MNKFIFVGRLVKDPEMSLVGQKSTPKCIFTIAIPDRFDKEKADFIRLTAWGKTAEFISNYFDKGRRVGVFGRIKSNSWTDEKGEKRYGEDKIVEEAYFVDNVKKDDAADNYEEPMGNQGYSESPNMDDDELPF